MWFIIILFNLLFIISAEKYDFPEDFVFGVASSAYQIEGAWNVSGKGESVWDRYVHTKPENIVDGSHADVACDSYHKIKEDVVMLKNLGVHFYRFSISWTRILPTGYVTKINPDGIRYYNELINELISNGITPIITLYHWDLPYTLFELGGWANPLIADYFADFTRLAFQHFGDRVKMWITINEPYIMCVGAYQNGILAPGYKTDYVGTYMCGHTALLAHAKAYHIYNEEFRPIQQGKIGISLDSYWYEPKTDQHEDKYLAETSLLLNFGWFVNPIFSESGDYPERLKSIVKESSAKYNYGHSRLPEFTKDEIESIKGSADFLGLNHYSSYLVESKAYSQPDIFMHPGHIDAYLTQPDEWEDTDAFWIKIAPWGLRKLLNWIKQTYNNPVVYITENGVADTAHVLNDAIRYRYLKGYLGALRDAIQEDGCNVKGYTAWTAMDNFEWFSGYTLFFGLYYVDFNNPNKTRIPKASAIYYKKVITTRKIDHEFERVTNSKEEL